MNLRPAAVTALALALVATIAAAQMPVKAPPPGGRTAVSSEIREAVREAGTIEPAGGPWGAKLMIKGGGLGNASLVRVVMYPGDDESQKPMVSQSATLVRRLGADQVEVQVPRDPAQSGAGLATSRRACCAST